MVTSYIATFGKALGIGLFLWLLLRAIRGSHPLDRTASSLRWIMVIISSGIYCLSLMPRKFTIPDSVLWIAIFIFTLFFFLPDLSYYLVAGVRAIRNRAEK